MEQGITTLGECRFEILTQGQVFQGLGKIWIGDTQVRSGRLPLHPTTQTFSGLELAELRLQDVQENATEVRLRLQALFRPLSIKLMRDHSFDPIHELGDWDARPTTAEGDLDLVLRPIADTFGGAEFSGFSYHYDYRSRDVALFYLLDRASWELDGDIVGATLVSQSSCSAPVVKIEEETAWTTEGILFFEDTASKSNPVMTHNLPRWASHGSFDFQYRGNSTVIGVFEHVDLIRSVIQRDAGKPELKVFDKYIFDQATAHRTPAKSILLHTGPKTETAQQNLWTWIFDEVHDRARREFGLQEEAFIPRIAHNFWDNFVIDDYRKDLLPAAVNLGVKQLFIDNLNQSAMTERCPHPTFHWNMCCGHEYETAPRLGGAEMLKQFVEDCRAQGIDPVSWTNNAQAYSSPVNESERDERGWFVRMEDTRLKYGGAYGNLFSILNFKKDGPRRYWIDSLKTIKEKSGLDAYLFDSFYNLGFMPINYGGCEPTTQWRELLGAFKELQDEGIHFLIESFGPFGQPQHGCPRSYNLDTLFACYKVGMGSGYTTIPTGEDVGTTMAESAASLYRVLAHMTDPHLPLFVEGQRIDTLWTEAHKRALTDYHERRSKMHRRFLQEDGLSVVWHDQEQQEATVWHFADREVSLAGHVHDVTTGEDLPPGERYQLQACHTYVITDSLPAAISSDPA